MSTYFRVLLALMKYLAVLITGFALLVFASELFGDGSFLQGEMTWTVGGGLVAGVALVWLVVILAGRWYAFIDKTMHGKK